MLLSFGRMPGMLLIYFGLVVVEWSVRSHWNFQQQCSFLNISNCGNWWIWGHQNSLLHRWERINFLTDLMISDSWLLNLVMLSYKRVFQVVISEVKPSNADSVENSWENTWNSYYQHTMYCSIPHSMVIDQFNQYNIYYMDDCTIGPPVPLHALSVHQPLTQ